jgi:hypothetical protein
MNEYVTKPYEESDLFYKIQIVLRGGQKLAQPKTGSVSGASNKLYSLDFVEKISRGDERIVNEMKDLFIQTAHNHVSNLEKAIASMNLLEISRLAHQMKPSLEQMQVELIKEDIRILEILKTTPQSAETVQECVLNVIEVLKMLINELGK